MNLLYVASSSYSGSTLLSFLLNIHPEIFTVGEMDKLHFIEDKSFKCSCGELLESCPFFIQIINAFNEDNIHSNFRKYGTAYRLVENERFNRYLTGGLPRVISGNFLENLRDNLVSHLPLFSKTLACQDRANHNFIKTALSYSGANIFVDACKDPYRLRHLRRIKELNLSVIYLVRDIRGIALSNLELKKSGWDAALVAKMWIHQQLTFLRILDEFPSVIKIYYEDLCDSVDETMGAIYKFMDLAPQPFQGDFKTAEHHILGNVMRLKSIRKIVKNTRWENELSKKELDDISRIALGFVKKNDQNPLSEIITHYLGH